MDWIFDISIWSSLLTLTILEIVLGIDNIIFITLLVGNLPEHKRPFARQFGLLAAMSTRIALLASVAWLAKLVTPLFTVIGHPVTGRDLVLFFGGLFLIYKAVMEIHSSLEGGESNHHPAHLASNLGLVIVQIAVIDIVFSLDSVITAVGLADHLSVMITAIVLAIGVMMLAARSIGEFVEQHPTIKMLALSFLVLVGVALVAEGTGHAIPKGYLYFAMAFALMVEILNLRLRRRRAPVYLHQAHGELKQR
ncbi:MAG: TerC family protein [Proteobacteria bacterium]|nr:TerC family protein [Pseudomonadota bacterium]